MDTKEYLRFSLKSRKATDDEIFEATWRVSAFVPVCGSQEKTTIRQEISKILDEIIGIRNYKVITTTKWKNPALLQSSDVTRD